MTETETVPEFTWYAVMTAPTQEFVAQHHLRLQGYRTFLPFERLRRRFKVPSRDEWSVKWVRSAYFPRYLFVRVGLRQSLYAVNQTFGVSTVVYQSKSTDPLPIPTDVIDELKAQTDQQGCIGQADTTQRKKFVPGQLVIFKDETPFAGLIARVSVDKGPNVRIWLKELLGKEREISVNPEHLRSAE